MGRALEVISGRVSNPSSTLTALTAVTGDSLTVRSANFGTQIELLQAWCYTTTNLVFRIRSPRMHDQAQNMRYVPISAKVYPLLPWEGSEPLYPQDPITVELEGGTTEVDIATLLLYYQDLPGINANLHNWGEIEPLIQHLTSVEVDLVAPGTSGQPSSTTALNGTFDTLIRNRQYAILGYTTSVDAGTLRIRGADTGNINVGGPLTALPFITNDWFIDQSKASGYPCIPVFNSANVAGVLLDHVSQGTSVTPQVTLNLALLNDGSSLS